MVLDGCCEGKGGRRAQYQSDFLGAYALGGLFSIIMLLQNENEVGCFYDSHERYYFR